MSFEASLFWGLVIGSIGLGYFLYGRKQRNMVALACGVLLMVYPYFVSSAWAMALLGLVLMAIPFVVRV